MTSIDAAFIRLRDAGEKGLVAYLTAGDPSPAVSLSYLRAAADAGADILEVGIPFSDPTADGPTIEAASRTIDRTRSSSSPGAGMRAARAAVSAAAGSEAGDPAGQTPDVSA